MRQQQLEFLRKEVETEITGIREALLRWRTYNAGYDSVTASERAAAKVSYLSWKRRMDQRLFDLTRALSRMESDGYGYCEDCGEEIPYDRLQAVPSAVFCVGCMRRREGG